MPDVEEFADISSHQSGADLAAYARGHRRILLKATEGTSYTNPHFAAWWRLSARLGLARGAYHFARPSSGRGLLPDDADGGSEMGGGYRAYRAAGGGDDEDAVAGATTEDAPTPRAVGVSAWNAGAGEAARFASALRAAGGLGPADWVCLDVEDPRERGPRAAAHAAAFCARMAELGFGRGVVYSYAPYVAGTGLTPSMLPPGWRRLHVANYGPTPDSRVPLPPGWGRELVVARQYSESARQAGIPGGSDANRVVREWLPAPASAAPEEDEDVVRDEDKLDIARLVLHELRTQVFDVRPEIRQGNAGHVIGQTYNKVGDVQATLGIGPGSVLARLDFVYDQLARLAPAAGVTLDPPPWRTG